MKTTTFITSGKAGDTIASLHAVKKHCERNNCKAKVVLDCSGKALTAGLQPADAQLVKAQVGESIDFPKSVCEYLRPLIAAQPYVESCEIYDGTADVPEVDINLNGMRKLFFDKDAVNCTNQNLQFMYDRLLGIPLKYEPWLEVVPKEHAKKVCVARSTRYLSAHLWLGCRAKALEKEAFFLGTKFEHDVWKNAFGTDIEYVQTKDALEAAQLIAGSKLFIAPGTLHYWIALGVGHKNIVNELGVDIPTTYYKSNPNVAYIQGGRAFTCEGAA